MRSPGARRSMCRRMACTIGRKLWLTWKQITTKHSRRTSIETRFESSFNCRTSRLTHCEKQLSTGRSHALDEEIALSLAYSHVFEPFGHVLLIPFRTLRYHYDLAA